MRELIRLRHRFILILMCSVGLLLTAALVLNIASSLSTQYSRIQNSLGAALVIEGGEELLPRIGGVAEEPSDADGAGEDSGDRRFEGLPRGAERKVPVYVVDISGDAGIVTNYGNAAEIDEETLLEALSRIESENGSDGLFLDLGLFYSVRNISEDVTRIAFADASLLYYSTLNQTLFALLIWALAMLAFFILSRVLSRMVLKPVESAWNKQRQFIADASHELKTPLTIILANNSIMKAHPEKSTAEQAQWLESTEEEATRMNNMVTDLLFLAQVENAKALPEADGIAQADDLLDKPDVSTDSKETGSLPSFVKLDLSAQVERSLLQFDAVFFERSMTVNAEIEKGLSILGNQEHVRRLVDILLDNALKYGNKGDEVAVRLSKQAGKQPMAVLSVSNNGALIPPDQIDLIFERFYRVDTAHSNAIEGSGLGLAMAKEIVGEHGGSIKVTSKAIREASEELVSEASETVSSQEAQGDLEVGPLEKGAAEKMGKTTFTATFPLQ